MNWFERYGIVGMFFIVMTTIWLFCFFPETQDIFNVENEGLIKYIVGFCGLAFLPIGYLIIIFSQAGLYLINKRNRTHCSHWRNLSVNQKNKIQAEENKRNLGDIPENDEAKMEAIITYYDRFKIKNVDANKFLSGFSTKRYDVISINNGLIWATCLSLICALCLKAIILDVTIKWNHFSVWFVIILALTIISVLFASKRILENQIIEIGKRKLEEVGV